MSHFFVGVLVPKGENVESYIDEVMSPYDENMRVDEYVDMTKEQILSERIVNIEKYKGYLLEKDAEEFYNIEHIKKNIEEWEKLTDEEYANEHYYKYKDEGYKFDSDGNSLSTYNPKSKWDWYVIGGRWNGVIRNESRDDEDGGFNFGDEFHQVNENMISVEDYIKSLEEKDEKGEWKNYPAYVYVSSEDGWIEKGQMGWWGISSNEKDKDDWRAETMNILKKYKDYNIVGVDCHI